MATIPLPTPAVPTVQQLEELRRSRRQRVPSERNRQIYEQVTLAERSQADVAKEFGISQQRVGEIVHQVLAWIGENVPDEARCYSPREQLTIAINEAYLHAKYVRFRALRAFDASRRDKLSERVKFAADGTVLWRHQTRGNQFGRSGYLSAMLRATMDMFQIAQMSGGCLDLLTETDWDNLEPAEESQIEKDFGATDAGRRPDEAKNLAPAVAERMPPEPLAASAEAPAAATAKEPADETENSPLLDLTELPLPGELLAPAAADASPSLAVDCSPKERRKSFLASANGTLKNPCILPLAGAPSDRREPVVEMPTDRRSQRREREKQLAHWRARRRERETATCA